MTEFDRRHPFLLQLRRSLRQLPVRGRRILVGVSGGADSVSLLRGLLVWQHEFEMSVRVAHVNHGVRGDESDTDAAWVQTLCDDLKTPCSSTRTEVSQALIGELGSFEAAARQVRYDNLAVIAAKEDCHGVAVAHTSDDQAETVLHHLLRGTGLAGLAGMPANRLLQIHRLPAASAKSLPLLRPLLTTSRSEVEDWLKTIGQTFRRDSSNTDLRMTRNRLRRETLPQLKDTYNPQLSQALCRLAMQARETHEFIQAEATRLLDNSIRNHASTGCLLDRSMLAGAAPVLVRNVFVQLWQRMGWQRGRMQTEHWQQLATLALKNEGRGLLTLPGVAVERRRNDLRLSPV